MKPNITFSMDGVTCHANEGTSIMEAARANGIFIPGLCYFPGAEKAGACRLCIVRVNSRLLSACTTPVSEGMEIDNNAPDIEDDRKAIIELLLTEGNHFCPACEKSGRCALQALAYHYQVLMPRFPYRFLQRQVDAGFPNFILDRNRCILCRRCERLLLDGEGKSIFAIQHRGSEVRVDVDRKLADSLTPEQAEKAADICPVGAILRKGRGFNVPTGLRQYDQVDIAASHPENLDHG